MLTLILIIATWYATKIYYTKEFTIQIVEKDPSMGHIICSGCSQTIYTNKDNFRAPYYCTACG